MEITHKQHDDFLKAQIGKECQFHPGRIIKDGKWGNWCGGKTEVGTWCEGNKYPRPNGDSEPLIIRN